jgi:hypothetical protein
MVNEILSSTPRYRSLKYILFVDQNRLLIDILSEVKKTLVQAQYIENLFRNALPLSAFNFSLSNTDAKVDALLINFPVGYY